MTQAANRESKPTVGCSCLLSSLLWFFPPQSLRHLPIIPSQSPAPTKGFSPVDQIPLLLAFTAPVASWCCCGVFAGCCSMHLAVRGGGRAPCVSQHPSGEAFRPHYCHWNHRSVLPCSLVGSTEAEGFWCTSSQRLTDVGRVVRAKSSPERRKARRLMLR